MDDFMKVALEEARKGIKKHHGGPFGAVIVKDGKIIAKGHNHVLIHKDPTCHGEINAIRKACRKLKTFDLTDCSIYTTHYPCPMCLGAIKWANIKYVYYGCTVEDTDTIGFRDKEFYEGTTYPIFISNIDRDECLKLSKEYVNSPHLMY